MHRELAHRLPAAARTAACPRCRRPVAADARQCPRCRNRLTPESHVRLLGAVLALFGLLNAVTAALLLGKMHLMLAAAEAADAETLWRFSPAATLVLDVGLGLLLSCSIAAVAGGVLHFAGGKRQYGLCGALLGLAVVWYFVIKIGLFFYR